MFLAKKVGDFNKKESESLDFTGLKIPRDHYHKREVNAHFICKPPKNHGLNKFRTIKKR